MSDTNVSNLKSDRHLIMIKHNKIVIIFILGLSIGILLNGSLGI